MSTPTFYYPQLLQSDSSLELSKQESAHAAKSRRLRIGQKVSLFNGCGLVADAELSVIERNRVWVNVLQCQQLGKNKNGVSVLTAVPKGDRQRVMIDALCQLGVEQITPLNCDHSVTRFSEKMAQKWQRFAVEACKQSQNAWLPTINAERSLESCLKPENGIATGFYYTDRDGECAVSKGSCSEPSSVFIGPEGGFSQLETERFKAAGGIPLQLGAHILRTEIAAIASVVILSQ